MSQAPTINPVATIGDVRFLPAGSDVLVAGVDVALDRIEIYVAGWSGDSRLSVHPFANRVFRDMPRPGGMPGRLLRGRSATLVHIDEVDAYPAHQAAPTPITRRGRRRARGRARAARAASC